MIFAILVFPPIQSYPYFKTVGSAPTGATQGPQEAEPFLCCTFVSPDESLYHNISGTPTYNGGGGGAYADHSVENATDSNYGKFI